MKKLLYTTLLASIYGLSFAQEELVTPNNEVTYQVGKGLSVNMEDGKYRFNMNGFMNSSYSQVFDDVETNRSSTIRLNSVRLRFNGGAFNDRAVFGMDANFLDERSILEAWVGWNALNPKTPNKLLVSFGQKRTFTNSREGFFDEPMVALNDRSILSTSYANSGRELGIFVEGEFKLTDFFELRPAIAITSGDGRNSFGSNSLDPDKGGFKYGGRLDAILGNFMEGNEYTNVDLMHQETPALIIGAAYSLNQGVSNRVGEGHGDFAWYNAQAEETLPNYTKIYSDLMLKWKGITLLGEFAYSHSQTNEVLYSDPNLATLVTLNSLSETLVLGSAFNVQLGYAFKNLKLAVDGRVSQTTPEFDLGSSALQENSQYSLGVSKYFTENNALKLQLIGAYNKQTGIGTNTGTDTDFYTGQLVVQMLF